MRCVTDNRRDHTQSDGRTDVPAQENFAELLRGAFPPAPRDRNAPSIAAASLAAADASQVKQIKLVEMTQYGLYVAFQALTLALATAVTISLIVAIWRLTAHPDTAEACVSLVTMLGAVVTGGAAGFVGKQARTAKSRYEDAKNYAQERGGF
jgi:hypothetical protein